MNTIAELKRIREDMIGAINVEFDRLLTKFGGENATGSESEYAYPFTVDTSAFIGKKPVAVLFGEERAEANTWRKVYIAIIKRCNADTQCHENLMYLRDKIAGKVRVFLSHSPNGMRCPLKIDEDMYAEIHYGTATLLYILRDRILAPAHFDYSNIKIAIK